MNCPRCGSQVSTEGFCPQCQTTTIAPMTNGMAVAGFVLSLVGLFCFGFVLEILAIIFSAVGLSKCNKNPQVPYKGLAIAGLVIGLIGLICSIIWFSAYMAALSDML